VKKKDEEVKTAEPAQNESYQCLIKISLFKLGPSKGGWSVLPNFKKKQVQGAQK